MTDQPPPDDSYQPPPDDSYQPPPDDPYRPVVEPQPLKFSPVPDVPGTEAAFQARVPGPGEPGEPAVTLTVTVDSSLSPESMDVLNKLLSGRMRGAFDVLPDLPADWDTPGGEPDGSGGGDEPVDLKKHMKIALGLVWPEEAPPVAVIVTVDTATGIVPVPRLAQIVRDLGVTPRYDDYWYAMNQNSPPTAKLNVKGGRGTMRRPGGTPRNVRRPPPPTPPLKRAKAFILHAVGGTMDYTLNSGFYSPQHPNNK